MKLSRREFVSGAAALVATSSFGNPIFGGWYADPQIRRYGDTYWVFPTTSAKFEKQTSFDAFSSSDMKTWTKHPRILTTKCQYPIPIGNTGNIIIKIPLADGNPDLRVYAYEVVVAGDEGIRKLRKAVYAAGCNLGIGHEPNSGVTTLDIPKSELPPGKTLTIAARPLSSLGTSGKAISAEFKPCET